MNKRAKGRYHEKIIFRLLKEAGWCVHLVQPAMAFDPRTKRYYAMPQDIFGADIIAMKKCHMPVFIQVTADSGIRRKARNFARYPFPRPLVRTFIFQAKKISGMWKYKAIHSAADGQIEEIRPEDLGLIFDFSMNVIERYFSPKS